MLMMRFFMVFFISKLVWITVALTQEHAEMLCHKQGLEGYVYRVSGNKMPSPDVKPTAPKGIKTTLYIFELTSLSQVTREGQNSFYTAIHTKLIKKVETDSSGHFSVKLSPGHYSLFTKKDQLYYANTFDGNNNIAPVEVTAHKMTPVEVRMDYDAFY